MIPYDSVGSPWMMGFLSIIYNRPLNLAHLVKSVPHWILEIPIIHSTIGQAWAAHPSNGWGAIVPWAPPLSLAAMMASQVSPRPLDLAGIRRYVLRALTPTLYGHKASLNCSASLASRGAVLNGVPQEQQNYSLSFAPGIRKPVATTCAAQNALPRRYSGCPRYTRIVSAGRKSNPLIMRTPRGVAKGLRSGGSGGRGEGKGGGSSSGGKESVWEDGVRGSTSSLWQHQCLARGTERK